MQKIKETVAFLNPGQTPFIAADQPLYVFTTMKVMGNRFQEDSADLLVLDTKNLADSTNAKLVGTHYKGGKHTFESFMEGMQNETDCPFYNPIKKKQGIFLQT